MTQVPALGAECGEQSEVEAEGAVIAGGQEVDVELRRGSVPNVGLSRAPRAMLCS
jgi:hypothetical protein